MNDALLDEIKVAYQAQNLVPIRRCFFRQENGVDYACPITCLAIHRGVATKDDSDLAKDKADNLALEWASQTFGEDFIWGVISAWDGQEMVKDDPEYLDGYALGLAAVEQLCPRDYAVLIVPREP